MRLLLIITGSVAAYKSAELIRRLRDRGHDVTAILTSGGAQFITPLTLSALTGNKTYTDLWSLKDEVEMGHIRLAREHDVIAVAPASADFLARLVQGRADDLAATTLLAADNPLVIAPAMNQQMWNSASTQSNLQQLRKTGAVIVEDAGILACGETGPGRMAKTDAIIAAIEQAISLERPPLLPLDGRHALVTAGPTREAIDPVRFISNHSSGKQGYAIAAKLARAGARVTLVSGPTVLSCPAGVARVEVESADQMLSACQKALPADIAICAAAVSDWRIDKVSAQKLKKRDLGSATSLHLIENPDILAALSQHEHRPALVVGFAAETESLIENASAKRTQKGCDWMIANDVSSGVFGTDHNAVTFCTADGNETVSLRSKQAVAELLVARIISTIKASDTRAPSSIPLMEPAHG